MIQIQIIGIQIMLLLHNRKRVYRLLYAIPVFYVASCVSAPSDYAQIKEIRQHYIVNYFTYTDIESILMNTFPYDSTRIWYTDLRDRITLFDLSKRKGRILMVDSTLREHLRNNFKAIGIESVTIFNKNKWIYSYGSTISSPRTNLKLCTVTDSTIIMHDYGSFTFVKDSVNIPKLKPWIYKMSKFRYIIND
jgi:hypothetical protein